MGGQEGEFGLATGQLFLLAPALAVEDCAHLHDGAIGGFLDRLTATPQRLPAAEVARLGRFAQGQLAAVAPVAAAPHHFAEGNVAGGRQLREDPRELLAGG